MGLYYWDELCVCVVSGSGYKTFSTPDLAMDWICRRSGRDYGPPEIDRQQFCILQNLWYSILDDFKEHSSSPPMYIARLTHFASTYGPCQTSQSAMNEDWVHRIYHATDFLLHLRRLFPRTPFLHQYFFDNPRALFMGHRRLTASSCNHHSLPTE
jgi:hypothetical protein